jgi:hypothetical protein
MTRGITFDGIVDIYLQGLLSGLSSALLMFSDGDVEHANFAADQLMSKVMGDPIALEQIREDVRNQLLGKPAPRAEVIKVFSAGGGS